MLIKYLVILPFYFLKKEGASELDFDLNSYLLIIDTGVVGITKETLKHIADNYDKYEKYIAAAMRKFVFVTRRLIGILCNIPLRLSGTTTGR